MRVLVVNAGSSSVKLRLLDWRPSVVGRTDLGAPSTLDGGDGPVRDRRADRLVRCGRCRAPGGARRPALHRPGGRRRRRPGRAGVARRPRAAAPAGVAGRHRRRPGGAAGRAGGGLLRHRLPRHHAGRGDHVRGAGVLAVRLRRPPVRLPRAVPRVRLPPRGGGAGPLDRRAAAGQLPPRRGRVAVRRLLWTVGRHDHGLHPAGGAGDGHPVRDGRPRAGALAAGAARAVRRRGRSTRWSTAPD